MECNCCKNTITPGMAIVVDEYTGERAYCPYCLESLQFGSPSRSSGVEKDGPDKRTEMRRTVREKFFKRLVEQSDDGQLHCPSVHTNSTRMISVCCWKRNTSGVICAGTTWPTMLIVRRPITNSAGCRLSMRLQTSLRKRNAETAAGSGL